MMRLWFALKTYLMTLGFPIKWRKPTTTLELLYSLNGKQVEVSTPFGFVTGMLLKTKADYIVLLDELDKVVLVRIRKIETVRPL